MVAYTVLDLLVVAMAGFAAGAGTAVAAWSYLDTRARNKRREP